MEGVEKRREEGEEEKGAVMVGYGEDLPGVAALPCCLEWGHSHR